MEIVMTHDLDCDDAGNSDWYRLPCSVTKVQLQAKLEAMNCTFDWCLQDALERCSALASVRTRLDATQVGCCVSEFKASVLGGLLPKALEDWPTWYVRLPDGWAADVPRLAAQTRLVNHLMRDEWNPWYVAQWLAIISEYSESGWPADARRLDIDNREAEWMLDMARHSEAVLVLFECSGILALTACLVRQHRRAPGTHLAGTPTARFSPSLHCRPWRSVTRLHRLPTCAGRRPEATSTVSGSGAVRSASNS